MDILGFMSKTAGDAVGALGKAAGGATAAAGGVIQWAGDLHPGIKIAAVTLAAVGALAVAKNVMEKQDDLTSHLRTDWAAREDMRRTAGSNRIER